MPSRPKQHHYVTRAYLDGFLEPGRTQLICYGRFRNKPFLRSTDDLATQRNYHSTKRADGTWDDSLEHKLQRDVEDPGLAVIRQLNDGKTRVTWEQRDRLSLLIAVQRFRVPHIRNLIDTDQSDGIRQWLSDYELREKETKGNPGRMIVGVSSGINPNDKFEIEMTKEELQEMLQEHERDPQGSSREQFMGLAQKFQRIFRLMKWTVYYARGAERFVTSDCPAAMVFTGGRSDVTSIWRPDCRIIFPLSRSALLLMEHDAALFRRLSDSAGTSRMKRTLSKLPEIRTATASAEDVRAFNEVQADQASRWVFAGQQSDWLIQRLRCPSKNVRREVKKIRGGLTMVSMVQGD